MTTTSDPKDDLIFLGINFNNFFKNCSCLQKRKDNDSVSSASGKNRPRTEQRKKFEEIPETANVPNDETHSIASSTDWADLEEISFPADPTLGAPLFDHNDTVNANLMEDFTTQEPIDFESLKDLTGIKEEDDDERSNKSGLSKGSKKIAKNANYQGATHASRFAPKDKDLNLKGKRKPWQPHEDAKVLELVGRYGQSWAVVATMMEGRTGKQIRDRYLNKLRPNIKRGEWTNEEDRILLSCYYQIGHKWSKIATYLPGRTEGQVKNRFYSHIKKKILAQDGSDQMSMGESPEQNFIGNYNGAHGMEVEGHYNNYGVRHNLREMSPNVAYQKEYVKSLPSPSGSSGTTATNSHISSDRDVNSMLDKMVGFMDKKNEMMQQDSGLDLSKLSMDDRLGTGYNTGAENFDNMAKVDRFDELQKRKNKLEFLLAQTLKDMGGVNPPHAGLI